MDDSAQPPRPDGQAEALRESREVFRLIVDSAEDYAIFTTDLDRRVLTWNSGAEHLIGYAEGEIVGRSADVIFTQEDRERGAPEDEARTALAEGRADDERWHRRRDGSRFWGSGIMTPLRDDAGGIRGFAKIFRDRTEQKRSERRLASAVLELEASEERYRLLVSEVRDYGIFMLDSEGRVMTWNVGAERIKGYTREEILGHHFARFFTEEDARKGLPAEALRRAEEEGRFEEEAWRVRKDGSLFWSLEVLSAVRAPDGTLLGFGKIVRDLTERKRAEDELRRAHDELELRVQERTAELSQALKSLELETAERRRTEQARLELLRRVVTVQEDERRRISRELHDEMGQHIAALILELKLLRDAIPEDSPARERLERTQRVTGEIGREIHRLAFELRPTALDDVGLQTTMANYLEEWSSRTGVGAEFRTVGLGAGRLPSHVETTIFRTVQETLTNVLKHAGATRVSVILEWRDQSIQLVVEDNGRGFDVDAVMNSPDAADKLGLLGMRERLAMVGGSLVIESGPGTPTTIFARIPTSEAGGSPSDG